MAVRLVYLGTAKGVNTIHRARPTPCGEVRHGAATRLLVKSRQSSL